MAADPVLDPDSDWPDLAPLGSELWVLTVKLMQEYVAAWDRFVGKYGEEDVLAERDRMRTKKRCRSRVLRDALLDLERRFQLRDRGVVDPHNEDDFGAAPEASPRAFDDLVTDHIETHPDYHISSDEAIVQRHQSDLPGMAERLTLIPFENLVKTAAGVLLDTGDQRYVRVLFDLDAPNKDNAAELFDLARQERMEFRRGHREGTTSKSPVEPRKHGWRELLGFALAVREARRKNRREAQWRIYKRLVDSELKDSGAPSRVRTVMGHVEKHISREEERLRQIRADLRRVEDEIQAGPRAPVRIYPRWVEAYLTPRTQRIYRARVSRLLSKLKDAAAPTKTSVK